MKEDIVEKCFEKLMGSGSVHKWEKGIMSVEVTRKEVRLEKIKTEH